MGKEKKGGVSVETREVARTEELSLEDRLELLDHCAKETHKWLADNQAPAAGKPGRTHFEAFRNNPDGYIKQVVGRAALRASEKTIKKLARWRRDLADVNGKTADFLRECNEGRDVAASFKTGGPDVLEVVRQGHDKLGKRLRVGSSLGRCAALATMLPVHWHGAEDRYEKSTPVSLIPHHILGDTMMPLARELELGFPENVAKNPARYCERAIRDELAKLAQRLIVACPDALVPVLNGAHWADNKKKGPWYFGKKVEFTVPHEVVVGRSGEVCDGLEGLTLRTVIPAHQADGKKLEGDIIEQLQCRRKEGVGHADGALSKAIYSLRGSEGPLYGGKVLAEIPARAMSADTLSIQTPHYRQCEEAWRDRNIDPRLLTEVTYHPAEKMRKGGEDCFADGLKERTDADPSSLIHIDFVSGGNVWRDQNEEQHDKAAGVSPRPVGAIYSKKDTVVRVTLPPYVDAAYRPDNAQ